MFTTNVILYWNYAFFYIVTIPAKKTTKCACIYTWIDGKEVFDSYILRDHFTNLIDVSDIPSTFASNVSLLASWGIRASGSCVVTPAGIKTPLPGLETD